MTADAISRPAETPALACPSWCTRNHSTGTNHMHHIYADAGIGTNHATHATLLLVDNGSDTPILARFNGRLQLHVCVPVEGRSISPAVVIDLDDQKSLRQARDLADLLDALGHGGLANAVSEMLVLAEAETGGDPSREAAAVIDGGGLDA